MYGDLFCVCQIDCWGDNMEIPQEVLDSGVLTAYTNTDPELVSAVQEYNEQMVLNQKKKRSLKWLGNIFLILNLGLLIIPGMIKGAIYLINPRIVWIENTACILFIVAFFVFGLWRRNLIAVTSFSALLLLADARYAFLIAVNIALTVIYEKNKRIVKSSTGYPTFLRIHIEKKNCKEPKKNNENNSDFPIDKSSEK